MTDPNPEVLDPDDPNLIPDKESLHLAGAIVLDYVGKKLTIDGVEFPYYLQKAGPTVGTDPEDLSPSPLCIVHLPVLCESYDVIGEPE